MAEFVKIVVYVARSKWGRWPAADFVPAARQTALAERITGALVEDGAAVFHIVEGPASAVDRFMAFVSLSGHLSNVRVVHDYRRENRMFSDIPLAHISDPAWSERIQDLLAGGEVIRGDVWQFCVNVAERVRQGGGAA